MKNFHRFAKYSGAAVLSASAGAASAAAPTTIAELASSVSFTDVATGILAVAGVVITLYVIWKGARFVLQAVKGA